MKKAVVLGSVFLVYFVSFAGLIHAGDATLTLDDNAGSSSFVVQDVDKTNQFKVNSDGNAYFAGKVGIGTTNPSKLFDVAGTARFNDLYVGDGNYGRIAEDITDTDSIDFLVGYGESLYLGKVIGKSYPPTMTIIGNTSGTDNNVGIGTTNPRAQLEITTADSSGAAITETVRITKTTDSYGDGVSVGFGPSGYTTPYSQIVSIWSSSNTGDMVFKTLNGGNVISALYLNNNGYVGIGTTAPSEKLEVSGNIKASGTVSQGSSREFKKNISYVSTKDAMNALNKLNPIRFEYKTDDSGEKHLGFIAEDVPDLVAEHDRKHLNAMDITAVLTKVVQEQQRIISEMSAKIERLEDMFEKQAKFN